MIYFIKPINSIDGSEGENWFKILGKKHKLALKN